MHVFVYPHACAHTRIPTRIYTYAHAHKLGIGN